MPPVLFPLVLVVHIVLAIALFLPSLLLPFAFRARRGSLNPERSGSFVRFLLALQARGTVWIGAGLAITGLALISTLGLTVLAQPWLLVALAPMNRTRVKQVLRSGRVSVNGDSVTRHDHPLRPGDKVSVARDAPRLSILPESRSFTRTPTSS